MNEIYQIIIRNIEPILSSIAATVLIGGFFWLLKKGKSVWASLKAALADISSLQDRFNSFNKRIDKVTKRRQFVAASQVHLDHLRDVRFRLAADLKTEQLVFSFLFLITLTGIVFATHPQFFVVLVLCLLQGLKTIILDGKVFLLCKKIEKASAALTLIALDEHSELEG